MQLPPPRAPACLEIVLSMPAPAAVVQKAKATSKPKAKAKSNPTAKPKKASFKRPRLQKGRSSIWPPAPKPGITCSWEDICSVGMPSDAYPMSDTRGSKSYTVRAASGARIEVRMSKQLFYVKTPVVAEREDKCPSITWSKFGGLLNAWTEAKWAAGWDKRLHDTR